MRITKNSTNNFSSVYTDQHVFVAYNCSNSNDPNTPPGEEFSKIGSEQSTGTRIFAVSVHVNNPGVFEVEFGTTTFRDLIMGEKYGQGILNGNKIKAFIPGGASAPWFFE